MPRLPLLSGTRLVVASVPDDAIVLRPPKPGPAATDVGAAVRDALRFPLEGEPLEALVRRRSRATILVEPPALPIPGSTSDPRQLAIAAVVDELERLGIPTGYQTILVACGLSRRTSQRELESLVTRELARRFHGNVVVHDAEDPELVLVEETTRPPLRVNRAIVETELVIVVSAAESVLHGGPATLLGAAGADAQRAAGAYSLLETSASQGWHLGLAVERGLARRLPVVGVSLVLNHPLTSGSLRGYPYEAGALDRITRSPLRHPFRVLPEAERVAAADERALEGYRAGRTVHPLLPFRDWNACQPALERLGAVLVAGAGDAATVRQLGFVPVHGLGAALELARGRTSGTPRIGVLVSPPSFPFRVRTPYV